jgi:diguanylate cyclase (GGDEF)-like protein
VSATASTGLRSVLRGPKNPPLVGWVAAVTVAGLAVLVSLLTTLPWGALHHLGPAFWVVCLLVAFGELRPLFTAGAKDANGLAVSTAFVFALLLHYGLPTALLLQALATLVSDATHRKARWKTMFNIAQYSLSWAAATYVMGLLGLSAEPFHPAPLTTPQLFAALAGAAVYFVCNEVLVTVALGLAGGKSPLALFREEMRYELLANGTLLALAPLVVLTMERGIAFVPLLLPPLVAVYVVANVALDREQQALRDALTGLPNRTLLRQRATAALRETESGVTALLLFDLDRFKEVNDTLGHHVGDRLLEVVALRLAGAVRPGDTVARLGGDEFALVLPRLSGLEEAVETAGRLREVLAAPIVLEGLLVDVGSSVGVALSPQHGTDVDVLLQRADVAMYLSKESGEVEAYDSARDVNSPGRLVILGELRRALDLGELELLYQPVAELATGRVVAVEALVRWRHPTRGLLLPDEFVPLAERSGLVQPLTGWVLDTALAQLSRWHDAGLRLRMAVNVTVKDLCGDALADQVTSGLARYGVPADCLQLEVTEGSLFADPVRAGPTLRRLGELGVTLSLDDFGTGYSSLAHLRQLPVREIKIDRSFVARMEHDAADLAIVRSIVDLALGLGMVVVAEGVETPSAWRHLQLLGCQSAQGWLLSAPEPASVLTPWLRARSAQARTGVA